ncbi:unnamed protein product [Darwinula stevensoni]|uniref:26S proteasome non-ATPase regulatory subunit 9 n=1 Tax=Darwinula stevensoni TaxID=69355 RepID=A0A7R8X2Q0_9CRUS|nr:unnamed protein product [Darwinula stevensoni]CAG0881453.1 unnamed protein product [Darwinula stevensoni]
MTDARAKVLELIQSKDKIDRLIEEQGRILEMENNVGMNTPLVDEEGYPRSDVDVPRVRAARHQIICLQNDRKALLKEIEDGLLAIHDVERTTSVEVPPQSSSAGANGYHHIEDGLSHGQHKTPFIRISDVSPGSPAALAGFENGDLITQFGSITSENYKKLNDIAEAVSHSQNHPLNIQAKREDQFVKLILTPQTWSGRGLLGCKVNPLK